MKATESTKIDSRNDSKFWAFYCLIRKKKQNSPVVATEHSPAVSQEKTIFNLPFE